MKTRHERGLLINTMGHMTYIIIYYSIQSLISKGNTYMKHQVNSPLHSSCLWFEINKIKKGEYSLTLLLPIKVLQ